VAALARDVIEIRKWIELGLNSDMGAGSYPFVNRRFLPIYNGGVDQFRGSRGMKPDSFAI